MNEVAVSMISYDIIKQDRDGVPDNAVNVTPCRRGVTDPLLTEAYCWVLLIHPITASLHLI